jgi:Ice-binding-like
MQKKSTQKQHPRISALTCAATLIVLGLLTTPWSATAAEDISLGEAENVAILGGSTVTNAGPTIVIGNVALSSPGVSITGFPPGTIVDGSQYIGPGLADNAHADASTAYAQVAAEGLATPISGSLGGGATLTPWVYQIGAAALLDGTLFLDTQGDPNAAFHFQIGSTLTTNPNSIISLLNGNTVNIFWQVFTSATIGVDSLFYGNILAQASITVDSGATINGRAMAIDGAVTLDTNNINGFGVVPEPSPWVMMTIGVGLLCAVQRYRKKS